MESHIGDIAHVIQLAVAPVFLLTAIGTLITALNTRLGRIVDRRRVLLERIPRLKAAEIALVKQELRFLARRIRLVYPAIFCVVIAALLICLVVVSAFLGALLTIDLSRVMAIIFILAMLALIAGLTLFLREIYVTVLEGGYLFH